MAYDPAPSTHFGAGYSASGNAIYFGTNDAVDVENRTLTTLTNAEAHATSGDFREVIRALLYKFAADWDATAVADRPAKMTLSKSLGFNSTNETVVESYVLSFEVGTTLGNVDAET
jgi:hypothetical protein